MRAFLDALVILMVFKGLEYFFFTNWVKNYVWIINDNHRFNLLFQLCKIYSLNPLYQFFLIQLTKKPCQNRAFVMDFTQSSTAISSKINGICFLNSAKTFFIMD